MMNTAAKSPDRAKKRALNAQRRLEGYQHLRRFECCATPRPMARPGKRPSERDTKPEVPRLKLSQAEAQRELARSAIQTHTPAALHKASRPKISYPGAVVWPTEQGWHARISFLDRAQLEITLEYGIRKGQVYAKSNATLPLETQVHLQIVPPGSHRGIWFEGRVTMIQSNGLMGLQLEGVSPERIMLLELLMRERAA